MFSYIYQPLDTVSAGAVNAVKSLELPRRDLLSQINLRLTVVDTITTVGPAVLKAHTPSHMLKRIEIIADGKDTIKSISMKALVMKNFFLHGVYPRKTVPSLSATALTFIQDVVLDFSVPRAVKPIDTLINTGKLSTFTAQFTFGDVSDMFSTQPTTHAFTSAEVKAHLLQAINLNVAPDKLNFSVYKESVIEKEVTGSTTEFQILLPVGNRYRGFLVEAEAAAVPDDAVINEIQIRSGTMVYAKLKWPSLRDLNALNFNMESETFTGWGYIDFCPEGRLVDALDASRLSMLELVADVSKQAGTNYIRVYPCELIVPAVVPA